MGVGLVKKDPWTKGESKAVEKVRGMLGVAGVANAPVAGSTAGSSTSANTTSASGATAVTSGTMSPKKVRLVTPSEQGKHASRSAAASRE
jgi:hypothetical protein